MRYHSFASAQNATDPSRVEDPAKDKQFAEPAVDSMRIQKDEVSVLWAICNTGIFAPFDLPLVG